jgi:hypothetical protein
VAADEAVLNKVQKIFKKFKNPPVRISVGDT